MISPRIALLRSIEYLISVANAPESRSMLRQSSRLASFFRSALAYPFDRGRSRKTDNPNAHGLGTNYDTAWARRPIVSQLRGVLIDTFGRGLCELVTTTRVINRDALDDLATPVIFAANHSSHFDTLLMLSTLPPRFRHRCIIAAGADYWFDTKWKARVAAFALNIIPIERDKVDRKSANLAAELVSQGWNLIIYPEGSRTRDAFAHPFRGGAAFLSIRCNVPVVPVHLAGTRDIFGVGAARATPGPTRVIFGSPIYPMPGERSRQLNTRIEMAVAAAADEARTDWWSATKRQHASTTPSLQAPDSLVGWRRSWASSSEQTFVKPTKTWPF